MATFVARAGAFDFTTFNIASKFNAAAFTVTADNIKTAIAPSDLVNFIGAYNLDADGNIVDGTNTAMNQITAGVVQYNFYDIAVPFSTLATSITTGDTPLFLSTALGGNDILIGSTGDDHLIGYAGDDSIRGREGNDILDGGEGTDTAEYGNAPGALSIDLRAGTGSDGFGFTDTFANIENINGSASSDYIIGSEAANYILAGKGDDLVGGAPGNDTLGGNDGNDGLDGGDGNDYLVGGNGDDRLDGSGDDDNEDGGAGNDFLTGGPGSDIVYGGSDNDAVGGGDNNDAIYGATGDDILDGGDSGNDLLDGGAGNDVLAGNDGVNILTGGSGNDVFIFNQHAGEIDTVTDFRPFVDKLYVPGFAAADLVAGAQVTDGGSTYFTLPDGQYIVIDGLQAANVAWFL